MPTSFLLDYAGPSPERGSLLKTLGRAIGGALLLLLYTTWMLLRSAILLTGVACVFTGTLLLTLGGKRSAARTLAAWRIRAADLTKLWLADMLRPLRPNHRHQSHPLTVLPA